ncbi:MAG: hypothetical protein ACRDK0_08960 [Solirubrobacteraceae bacterium]
MEALLPVLVLLACPVGMGLMMFFMARGRRSGKADSTATAQPSGTPTEQPMSLEVLREEHRRLGEEIGRLEAPRADRQPADRR